MARLFVAVQPPDRVLDVLEALPRPEARGVRYTRREHWHVTLRFLGDASPEDAVAALDRLSAESAEAVLGPRVSRLGRNVVCVPVAGLDELAAAVNEVTADVGEPPDPRPFAGHITLARLKHRAACGLAGEAVSGTFAVRAVELVDSTLGADGPSYRTVMARHLDG